MTQQNLFMVVDTGPGFSWYRQAVIRADSRDAAQEIYIDQCELSGVAHGTLNVCRTRNLAGAA